MMSRNQPRQTKAEKTRIALMLHNGCMLTWLKFGEKKYAECHHLVMAGKRLGHWYTIPLSPWYHRGVCDPGKTTQEMRERYGASLADGRKSFVASHHYTELELWKKLQVVLGLDDSLPTSKRVPRRIPHVQSSTGVDAVPAGEASLPRGLPQHAGSRTGDQEEAS